MAINANRHCIFEGRVTNHECEPLEGLIVRAYGKSSSAPESLLGREAVTDHQGKYTIRYTEKKRDGERGRVWMRSYDGETLLGEDTVEYDVASRVKIDLKLDCLQATSGKLQCQVNGSVEDADENPVPGVNVQVFVKGMRDEQRLGNARTDQQGRYQIPYAASRHDNRKPRGLNLVVKAFDSQGDMLVESPILFDAPPVAEVRLRIPTNVLSPLSLFEKLKRTLKPLLNGLELEELEQNSEQHDLSFLSGETGYDLPTLARFVLAHKLAQRKLPAEFWFALLGGSVDAFGEQVSSLTEQLAKVSHAFPALDATAVQKLLLRGFNTHEIPDGLRDKASGWSETFLKFVAELVVSDKAGSSFLKLALEHAGIQSAKKQELVASLLNQYKALTPELLRRLRDEHGFKQVEIADLQSSFQLADLTGSDFSMVKLLKDDFDVRRPEQIRSLAKRGADQWIAWVSEKDATGKIQFPFEIDDLAKQMELPRVAIYGELLERRFREAFPTPSFAGGLERALHNGGVPGFQRAKILSTFLDRHENFDLLRTPIEDFLQSNLVAEFATLRPDEVFRREIKALQRVFKLAPTFEATQTLLAEDFHSAQQIYRVGENEFIGRYTNRPGFTAETARLVWNRAANTQAAVLTVVAELKAFDAEGLPSVLKNNSAALSTFPNWDNLFQAGDFCECDHCRSVLGPAAYFADLLLFLKDRSANNPAQTAKDVLLTRRPDLGYLELNCENALTPFPYIDTACEVLEDAIAKGANDIELGNLTSIPVDATAAHTAVTAALSAAGIHLGDSFSLSQVDPGDSNRWIAHGDQRTCLLKKNGTTNFFAEVLRNTKADVPELRAFPQYVNPKAYEKLRSARYPATLPFDLFAEEVRAAFQKTSLERWDLMQTLSNPALPHHATAGEIAAEYFGVSSDSTAAWDEKRLILTQEISISGQQAVWGVVGPAWLITVSQVGNFLRKTGLEYQELLALLGLEYLNPAGELFIEHLDSSCDIDQKTIQGLDVVKLDRIHRFLRLWRKLQGWKMWELDLVLRHPRIGNGTLDEQFLIQLFYFSRLKNKLGARVTVEQVCALFGNLNAATRFTKLYERRDDALYQHLFLNKRLSHPRDSAFELDPQTGDLLPGETIASHQSVVLAALEIREGDITLLKQLTKVSDGAPYMTDDLTLGNLSFLWRHAWLCKQLRLKLEEWKVLLKIFGEDLPHFDSPESAWKFLEQINAVKRSGFTLDELNWILAADKSARAATKETEAARFLATLRKDLQAIQKEFDPAGYDVLSTSSSTDTAGLVALLASILQKLRRSEAETKRFLFILEDNAPLETKVVGLPAGFNFPAVILNAIRIRYDEPTGILRFSGLMTVEQRTTLLTDPSLSAVTGIIAYQEAIEELFRTPRLALKFFNPVFTTSLAHLPPEIDFKNLAVPGLASKISYDAEQQLLRLVGILSRGETAALEALSTDSEYRTAIASLASQPELISPPDARIWLIESDLEFPLRNESIPAQDHWGRNLATAATCGLEYLSKTLSAEWVIKQFSARLGLTEALTRRLLTRYEVLPQTLLDHLTVDFAATNGSVDYVSAKNTLDGWFWFNRVALLLKKWKWTAAELEKIEGLVGAAQLLDFSDLPLDEGETASSLDRFLRTDRLRHLRDDLPETEISLLDIWQKLDVGAYLSPADFAADVQHMNSAWPAAAVQALMVQLDLAYPADYLLVESWDRVARAFYYLGRLGASPDTVKIFAAPTMTGATVKTLRELLQAKFGAETWLELGKEIQDVLRERKLAALTAYRLAEPQPVDAPTGKWESTQDLYAYYLLDVERCSCQLTSRLVQGSGSIQLFVQRCLMGLEPAISADSGSLNGDSAWQWWKWMRKYRIWEANRKVFLWPENWIEPELKPDRSPFFKNLENELLQDEINQDTAERALANYLEQLDGVAQLEIAGFYQEDDGTETILHLFGRTPGAEPHLYYYRRYDYRQWTPWERVELDIPGDYLIPAVFNKRLILFWPLFSEVPDEAGNSIVRIPQAPGASETTFSPDKTKKKLRLQIGVSDYRQGKWTAQRISKDFVESAPYVVEILKKHYRFFPIDRSTIDGRFGIRFEGYSEAGPELGQGNIAGLFGAFEISGCAGVPERTNFPGYFAPALRPEISATGSDTTFLKWVELGPYPPRLDAPENDFTLENRFAESTALRLTPLLLETPWNFKMMPPWHLSYLDQIWLDGLVGLGLDNNDAIRTPVGTWLPFFYSDKKRTFFVLPSIGGDRDDEVTRTDGNVRSYYPEVKKKFRQLEASFASQVRTWIDKYDLSTLTATQRQQIELVLHRAFSEAPPPPYSDLQVKKWMQRHLMRLFHRYLGGQSLLLFQSRKFHFKNHYHPFVCDFAKRLNNPLLGIAGLMNRQTQLQNSGLQFRQTYQPTAWVVDPVVEDFYPQEVVDFTPDGAYSSYNWELFFHVPLLIANALSKNQRFEEARDWYHFIFNPIGVEESMPGGSPMSKYWITKPFFEMTDPQYLQQRIDNLLKMLAGDTSVPGYSAQAQKELEGQVLDWRRNPFEPHRIANYRTVAYQKAVLMKYLDNLMAWADSLFRQDSPESVEEAMQLYLVAAEILGPRPLKIPPQSPPPVDCFNELENKLDKFSNALVEVENLVPVLPGGGSGAGHIPPLPSLYFCIPLNDKLLSYWDTVADRLYKIRHCLNIEGQARSLALFEPPLDPAALIKATAAGVEVGSVLADLAAPLPSYRFNVLLQKAQELCSDVKLLGAALLAALEKKDAELLGLLRQGQEIRLLESIKAVRQKQIEETKENLAGMKKSKDLAEIKKRYFESREFISGGEAAALALSSISLQLQTAGTVLDILGGVLAKVPDFNVGSSGFGGSPVATVRTGGSGFSKSTELAARSLYQTSGVLDKTAAVASTVASYERRKEEWDLQTELATKEIEQLDRSIVAAELRLTMVEQELENHLLQIDNLQATDDFMRSKYTNQELYQWQVGQISDVYFQSYKLAYDLAKRAERCFRFELGLPSSEYIRFGSWDSLKKGLLSGEKLQYDLRCLEAAYLEQNRREFELTKHVSLMLLDPLALVQLRETGRCFFQIPEELFDLDFPGHYFRRIKSLSLSLPCISGPFTTISCTLRLLKNSIRTTTADGDDGYQRNTDDQNLPAEDGRFVENSVPVNATAISSAQNDSGMFELNFRDERYLPFEGAGAISQWSLELFHDLASNNPDPASPDFGKPLRQFDYSTISDAVVHIKYTAREDAGVFKNSAISHLRDYFSRDGLTPSWRMFDLRQEFPDQWHRFLHPSDSASGNVLELMMSPTLFRILDGEKILKINTIGLLARCSDPGDYSVVLTPPLPIPPPVESDRLTLTPLARYGGLHFDQKEVSSLAIEIQPTAPPTKWRLEMTRPGGGILQWDPIKKSAEVTELFLVVGYDWG